MSDHENTAHTADHGRAIAAHVHQNDDGDSRRRIARRRADGLERRRLCRRLTEVKAMRFGMIALTDCSPIVMAHELGYFKFGIDSVSKEASSVTVMTSCRLARTMRRTC